MGGSDCFRIVGLELNVVVPRAGLERQPGGRIILVGRNTARAYTAARAVDPAYGVDGIASFFASGQFEGPTAIDTQGRLYLGVTTGVLRLLADGAVDPGFSYAGTAQPC